MKESKKYIKEELEIYTKEELESLKIQERAYLDNGETLLEAMLRVPFKNKDKFEQLREKINVHISNIHIIENVIESKSVVSEIDLSEVASHPDKSLSGLLCGVSNSNYIVLNTRGYTKLKTVRIKYADSCNYIREIEVTDDIFQSVLGNYYMIITDGSLLPLERIVEIESESKTGKWYTTMCKNFERNEKLKRVLKDGEGNEE